MLKTYRPKVINVSPHRSGTKSVTAFAKAHGLCTLHWHAATDAKLTGCEGRPDLVWKIARGLLKNVDVASDLPWPLVAEQAAKDLPDARFLLLLRDSLEWVASVRKLTGGAELKGGGYVFYFALCGGPVTRLEQLTDIQLAGNYERFCDDLQKTLGPRLTVAGLDDPDVGTVVAKTLGIEIKTPFPWVNVPFADKTKSLLPA